MTKYIIIDTKTPDEANTRISSISIHTLQGEEIEAIQVLRSPEKVH